MHKTDICWTRLSAKMIIVIRMLGKNSSRWQFEIYFSYYTQKKEFDSSCKFSPWERICMKFQILFSVKNKKNIINLLSGEFAHSMLSIKIWVITFFFPFCGICVSKCNSSRTMLSMLEKYIASNIWATSLQNQQNDLCPEKTQTNLGIHPVWFESPLSTQWVAKDPSFLHADSEDSDQTGLMPRLLWIFAGRTCHFVGFVMRWLIWILSYFHRKYNWIFDLNMSLWPTFYEKLGHICILDSSLV